MTGWLKGGFVYCIWKSIIIIFAVSFILTTIFSRRRVKEDEKGGTLVSFTPKDETMQNAKKPKKIVRLALIDDLMCPR